MLNVAIIGAGWAGTRQVEAAQELGRKVVVNCLVDNDPQHLASTADKLGIEKRYGNFREALADPAVDAVSICTPHPLHHPIALAAAAAKKHILVEKPIALTVEEATEMIDAVDNNDVKLYVAESLTYAAMSKALRQIVQSGQYIGRLTAASFVGGFHAPNYGYPGRRAWLAQPEAGGSGTWMLHGIHSMAQLRYILGEVDTVYMREHKAESFQRTEVEGTMSGLLTLETGVNVSVVQTAETKLPANLGGYILHGDAGSVRASREGYEVFAPDHALQTFTYPQEALSEYAQELEAFADYVSGVSVGPTTAESERRSLAIVQAGYESAQSGRPVSLKQRFGDI